MVVLIRIHLERNVLQMSKLIELPKVEEEKHLVPNLQNIVEALFGDQEYRQLVRSGVLRDVVVARVRWRQRR